VKAALFDAGDTLIHQWVPKQDRFCWLCEQAGLEVPDDPAVRLRAAVAGERFFAQRQSRKDRDTLAFWTDWARVGLAELGLSPDSIPELRRHVGRLRKSQWLDPEAIPLLEALRETGYRIGLVSNWDGTLADTCEEVGLAPYIDYIGDSHVFGVRKPDVSFFRHVLEQLGVEPQQAFHVGDSWGADVVGAEAAGIIPILLDCLGHEERPCPPRVQSLREVLTLADTLWRT
jgi:putative hydrolase of the HAD superfamily